MLHIFNVSILSFICLCSLLLLGSCTYKEISVLREVLQIVNCSSRWSKK